MDEVRTALRKARAARVAEFMYLQRMDRIEWEEGELLPYLEKLKETLALSGTLPVFELEAHED